MRLEKSIPHFLKQNKSLLPKKGELAKGIVKAAVKTAVKAAVPFGPSPVSLSISAAAKLLAAKENEDKEIETKTRPVEVEEKAKKDVEEKKEERPEPAKEIKETKKLEMDLMKKIKGTSKKPAIFFIGGFQLFSSSLYGDGMEDMAEAVKDAKHFGWEEKAEILEEIEKRHPSTPIILVGHSLGGDTAVEVANELNSLDNQFRNVDLLVTLDSFGFNNDIISQNVQKNINFISDGSSFLNDGPNIARNINMTDVQNELRAEGHTELDDNEEIQLKIFKAINEVIN